MVIRCVESACGLRERGRVCPAGEDGSITILSLFFFIMMLTICGIAVDYMRLEALRVKLQSTADRAALAATKLDQSLDPESVVRDYFARDGLVEYVKAVRVHRDTGTDRALSVDAELEAKTFFMHLAGVEDVTVRARATAVEQRSNLEISLVLDVSSSMTLFSGSIRTKIQNLRIAAQEFIDAIYGQQGQGPDSKFLTTVSIVPYSNNVNIGPTLANYYNLQRHHPYSLCPTLTETSYSTTRVDPDQPLGITSHMQLVYSSRYTDEPISTPECPTNPMTRNQIDPLVTDPERAKSAIRSLSGFGGTAIDLGMKWGVALLDPLTRTVTAGLVSNGHLPGRVATRPYDYSEDINNLKIIVLMTDGENTSRKDLIEPYKSGMSDIWVYRETPGQPLHEVPRDRFSLQVGEDQFFRLGQQNIPTPCRGGNAGTPDSRVNLLPGPYAGDDRSGGSATRVSWAELYATWMVHRIGSVLFKQAADACLVERGYVRAPGTFAISDIGHSQADRRLLNLCATAKDSGIVIFSIAFEAPADGQQVLSECASSDAHYFDVRGTEIREAFAAIARTIQVLRLTE